MRLETRWPIFSHLINLTIDGKPLLFQYLDPLAEGFVVQLYGTKVSNAVFVSKLPPLGTEPCSVCLCLCVFVLFSA